MCRRIVLKGTSGAGKSTLAAELAQRLSVTHIELDALHHGPNWSAPTNEEFQAKVRQAIASAPFGWVIDGNYDSKLGDTAIAQANEVIWLDLPFTLKFIRVWLRTVRRIRTNEVLWNGNRESWRGAFLSRDSLFVWLTRTHLRHRREWPWVFSDDPRFVRFRSEAQVRDWINEQHPGEPCRDDVPLAGSSARSLNRFDFAVMR
jgi:adenylate kinase family enzyme